MADLYDRQKDLDLNIPEKVCILGAGGIGSWVAVNMGLIGVKELFIIDYDVIEEHNLNRTPFRDIDIHSPKTVALMDLILERRADTEVRTFDKRIEDLTDLEMKELDGCLILDCRDVIDELPEGLKENKHIKLGYDGLSVTMLFNPDFKSIWDLEPDTRGYQVTPSFLGPCQFLASAITTIITDPNFDIDKVKNETITFNLDEHLRGIIND